MREPLLSVAGNAKASLDDLRPRVDVRVSPEEFDRLYRLEADCGILGFNFDEGRWAKGASEILGDRMPPRYSVGVIEVVRYSETPP